MRSRSRVLLDKATQAMVAAIEVYNKPQFSYREETFCILAVNAWELLLKARILMLERNRVSAILQYEKRKNADGSVSRQLYRKKNRSGNYVSIGLFRAFDTLVNDYSDSVPPVVRRNLELLTEIRDNSIHYINNESALERKVQEIATASLMNYMNLVRQWFGVDFTQYHIFPMPLAFVRDFHVAEGVTLNGQEKRLLHYLEGEEKSASGSEPDDFSLAVKLDLKMYRSSDKGDVSVRLSNSPDAVPVQMTEEDIRERYPWDYDVLTTRLKKRYVNFKQNQTYHRLRQSLETDERFCKKRLLDPGNPKSNVKKFYNPSILQEFDKHYTRANKSMQPPPQSGAADG
ncbi:DUF3644 domain-containing protein [Halorhodospira sp. 9622]|uniref:DUF3644 domain-containing protein n=1 Tax=Halorhodospira sp. 9622 TaxID=2899136 RepID=UPI001EE93E74|nr:DUF3644 domain-containing protein [Halorhodospira sp. 9622]MCG5539324.1 DUF3644 domain-containing protein [Halorhodospira sp. 9622]